MNVDQDKYGSIPHKLSEDFAMGDNQYPTSITAMTNVLSNHTFDPAYKKRMD